LTETKLNAKKDVIQLELDKSCHVNRSVVEESRDDCVICLTLCDTWALGMKERDASASDKYKVKKKVMDKTNTKILSLA
jgi:hypothetical protein